jgi:hypothetical protein
VNWKRYNDSLIRRGKILLYFDDIDNLDVELEKITETRKVENLYTQIHLSYCLDM